MTKQHPWTVGDKVQTLPGTSAYPMEITVLATRFREADNQPQVQTNATADMWVGAHHFRVFDTRRSAQEAKE